MILESNLAILPLALCLKPGISQPLENLIKIEGYKLITAGWETSSHNKGRKVLYQAIKP